MKYFEQDESGEPVHPCEMQSDGTGGVVGLQTTPISGWATGISIRELAAIEFTKVHLQYLMQVNSGEGTKQRIAEAVTRGWNTAGEWMEARRVLAGCTYKGGDA